MGKHNFTDEDDALLVELGVQVGAKAESELTPLEERIIDGFEDIQRFYDEEGREPRLDEVGNVFEKRFAIRLSRLRKNSEYVNMLKDYDRHGLLQIVGSITSEQEVNLSDDDLLAELGVEGTDENSVTKLRHIKPKTTLKAPDEIASRSVSPDFEVFKPLFAKVKDEISRGLRTTTKYKDDASILKGDLFIVGGQIAYIAEMGAEFTNKYGRQNSRMRVVFDNGTHTVGMLMRSFQRALNKDGNARRIEPLAAVSLFSDNFEEDDLESGTIYVLRSLSNHPLVEEHRDIVHKIGVTGGDVKKRVANAKYDSTFLMADVEIVAEYHLANINRVKLESLIHKFFSRVQLSIDVKDRFGKVVTIKEWFLVPLFVIDQMIEKLKSGELSDYYFDKDSASIRKIVH